MGRRSRPASPQLTIIYWRDIPAQVKARAGRDRVSADLPNRFMASVDAAAMKAGKTSTDDYIAEWREETTACGPDLQEEADSAAARITQEFPASRVRQYVLNGGWAPDENG